MDRVIISSHAGSKAAWLWRLEGVTVWRLNYVLNLSVYGTEYETKDRVVLLRETLILCKLIRRVTKPFSVNVPSNDKRLSALPFPFVFGVLSMCLFVIPFCPVRVPSHGRIEGVGERVLEDSGQILVYHPGSYILNHLLDDLRFEGPAW